MSVCCMDCISLIYTCHSIAINIEIVVGYLIPHEWFSGQKSADIGVFSASVDFLLQLPTIKTKTKTYIKL